MIGETHTHEKRWSNPELGVLSLEVYTERLGLLLKC